MNIYHTMAKVLADWHMNLCTTAKMLYWEVYIQLISLWGWILYIYDDEVLPMSSWNVIIEKKSPRLLQNSMMK